jgi:hypothetical protein
VGCVKKFRKFERNRWVCHIFPVPSSILNSSQTFELSFQFEKNNFSAVSKEVLFVSFLDFDDTEGRRLNYTVCGHY